MAIKVGAYPDLVISRGGNTMTVSQVTIGATSATLLAANPKRVKVLIKNTHATQTLDISGATPAVDDAEWQVAPASADKLELEYTGIIYAISDGAGTVVELIEISQE